MAETRDQCRRLRRDSTKPERLVWALLRGRRCRGIRFRRQHPVGPYIADFACLSPRLIVEIDGSSHDHRGEHDVERTEYLRSVGWRVVRFSNEDVLNDPQVVVDAIARELTDTSASGH